MAVGETGRVTEGMGAAVTGDQCFERSKSLAGPARDPGADLILIGTEILPQRLQHAQIAEWMNVAGDDAGHGTDDRGIAGIGGQQGRLRPASLDPFQDRAALRQHAVAIDQRGHQPLRRERPIIGRALRTAAQIMGDLCIVDALQGQRDPYAIARARPPIAMKDEVAHRAGTIIARHSPKPIDTWPGADAVARNVTSSPSSRKQRVSPDRRLIGSRPPLLISIRLP